MCSELQSTATSPSKPKLNDHKRPGGQQLVTDEGMASKKRHCISIVSHSGGETATSIKKKTENKQSASIVQAEMPFTNASGGVRRLV